MTQSVCAIMWIFLLLMEVGIYTSILAKLCCDNFAALRITFNLVFQGRANHIEINCLCVRKYNLDLYLQDM